MDRKTFEKLLREYVASFPAVGVSPPGTENSGTKDGTKDGTEPGTEPGTEGTPPAGTQPAEPQVQEFAAVGGGAIQGLTAPLGAEPKTVKNTEKNRRKKSTK